MTEDALAQARAQLAELTEAARKGQIIPIRLTGQLEAIGQLLEKAGEQKAAASGSPDLESYKKELGGVLTHGFHDLRLPLTSIRGYSDMLGNPAMGELTDMQKQFVTTIRTNTKRMESLLTDVSDISKLYNGTLKPGPKMEMFKNVAQLVEKAMRQTATDLNRTFELDIPQGLPLLNVDTDLLVKALNKVVENALRYAEPEGGTTRLSASGDGNTLHIQVQDNGIGITEDELAKLGTPFFRSDNELVLGYKGSGLGIPIAYGLVKLLGGTINVASQVGQGTTVTVSLVGMS
ncbi:MAG: HAMP domain-containing histidine kinase [Chloroflexi bacterium]|nr:HAMP domain-containing histidine kinase [Chloroflexota bacterium]MCC6895957.1 HAMP domain-containing histidine kinase [Anaerolineae bacterium]